MIKLSKKLDKRIKGEKEKLICEREGCSKNLYLMSNRDDKRYKKPINDNEKDNEKKDNKTVLNRKDIATITILSINI